MLKNRLKKRLKKITKKVEVIIMANTEKNEDNMDYVDKLLPNSDGGKLLILQYNPSDGKRESWLSVAGECDKNGQNAYLQLISVVKGDSADQLYELLTGKQTK